MHVPDIQRATTEMTRREIIRKKQQESTAYIISYNVSRRGIQFPEDHKLTIKMQVEWQIM